MKYIFTLIVTFEAMVAICFILCFVRLLMNKVVTTALTYTFAMSVILWGGFMLGEEIFVAYKYEPTHIRLLVLSLVSYGVCRLVISCSADTINNAT